MRDTGLYSPSGLYAYFAPKNSFMHSSVRHSIVEGWEKDGEVYYKTPYKFLKMPACYKKTVEPVLSFEIGANTYQRLESDPPFPFEGQEIDSSKAFKYQLVFNWYEKVTGKVITHAEVIKLMEEVDKINPKGYQVEPWMVEQALGL